jgi:hypothetical protein
MNDPLDLASGFEGHAKNGFKVTDEGNMRLIAAALRLAEATDAARVVGLSAPAHDFADALAAYRLAKAPLGRPIR